MSLYHFTSPLHLPHILAAGYLKTVESNVDMFQSHAGPDVVWLLDTPTSPVEGHLFNGLSPMKTQIRFTVDVPGVKWTDWQWTKRMDPEWFDTFTKVGGSEHWYVWPAPILAKRWTSITDMNSGKELWTP